VIPRLRPRASRDAFEIVSRALARARAELSDDAYRRLLEELLELVREEQRNAAKAPAKLVSW
jgi:hypothetical protein